MCGIAGVLYRDKPVERIQFTNALKTLAPRGPDGSGEIYLENGRIALGHTRLAIIDLSINGQQPMCNEDATIWVTFNGEIYNYQHLRTELQNAGHQFKSQSDTETIIHAYEQWGEQCPSRLRGIFAFAIYDTRKAKLFAARDPIGVKPFFYQATSDSFFFGSSPRFLLALANSAPTVDEESFNLFLAYGNTPGAHCIYSGIRQVLPGHSLTVTNGKVECNRYWELRYTPRLHNIQLAKEAIRTAISANVKTQMVSDVPVASLLSGGIDSTIVTALMCEASRSQLASFTVGFDDPESDERSHSATVAQHLGTMHHETVLTATDAYQSLGAIADAMDEPFHLNGLFPYQALMQLLREHRFKVALGGDGADEVFAGYLWHDWFSQFAEATTPKWWRRYLCTTKARRTRDYVLLKKYLSFFGGFDGGSQLRLLGIKTADVSDISLMAPLISAWRPDFAPALAAQFLDFHVFLPDHCLRKVDRMSMGCGVEVRVPLLDVELIETAFSISHEIIYKDFGRKGALKLATSDLFPPAADLSRKKGFSSPLTKWLEGGLAEVGKAFLLNGSLVSRRLLSGETLTKNFDHLMPTQKVLLISGELWARRWLDNDAKTVDRFSKNLTQQLHT